MSTLEKVIEELKTLTPEERQQLRELLDREARSVEQEQRSRLAASIRGKYRDVLSSSEDFIARKREEIAREDRHR
jgi:Spy/CpxP family protein refolding chaperone